jgi:hypothetical protein
MKGYCVERDDLQVNFNGTREKKLPRIHDNGGPLNTTSIKYGSIIKY